MTEAQVGQPAPNFTLINQQGTAVTFSEINQDRHVVLFFVRAPGCWQCREHVEQLARFYPQFKEHHTEILVILNASPQDAQKYAEKVKAPFPILADPDHKIYDEYGLNKVMFINTRTGSIVVDKTGKISYLRSALNPSQWLKESQQLVEHVKTLKAEAV